MLLAVTGDNALSTIEEDGSFTFLQANAGGLSRVDSALGPHYFRLVLQKAWLAGHFLLRKVH